MSINLTPEQQNCIHLARSGHNFTIFGEAGTGKSLVVSEICRDKRKEVQVVCSTGIACEVFKGDENLSHRPVTVHSFFGLQTAQGPFDLIVRNACDNVAVKRRVLQLKCLIWDECSMGSARIVELIHAICCKVRNNSQPFGGVQSILVGDWLQLKPVADHFDDGRPMYTSCHFGSLFPHTVELSIVHRQKASERKLLQILKRIRQGRCDDETEWAIQSLERPILSTSSEEEAVHLYFTNLEVDAHNMFRLAELPGNRVGFIAQDTNDVRGISCPALDEVFFKPGAPVMVLYNINDKIHNGTRATFVRKIDNHSAVINVDGGEVKISSVTWTNVNREGNIIGSRHQIPLKLYWAATVHKSQGLTMNKAVIHSAYEFTGGLLYTALSRVRTIDHLQVLDFIRGHVANRDRELEDLQRLPHHAILHCPCWTEIPIVVESESIPEQEELSDELLLEIVDSVFDNQEGENDQLSMEAYLELMDEEEHILSNLPEEFDVKLFLEALRIVVTGQVTEFVITKNDAIEKALQSIPLFSGLIQSVWFKVFSLLKEHPSENVQDTRMSMKELKGVFHQTIDISRSIEFRGWLETCWNVPHLSSGQISVGFDIVVGVYNNVMSCITKACRERLQNELVTNMKVRDMDSAGLGKVRFVGAFAIGKVLKKSKRYARDNLYTENDRTLTEVKKALRKVKLIENNVILPYDIISSKTTSPATLEVTEVRQYRTHGLIHVSDQYFEFVLELEQSRVDLLNTQMFKIHGEKLIEVVEERLTNDVMLGTLWNNLFTPNSEVGDASLVKGMYKDIIQRYINVSANQFVSDFRGEWQVKKAMAHRQMVLARKEKKSKKEAKVQFNDILDDHSNHKEKSHNQLKALVSKFGEGILAQLYTRKELKLLQKSYGLTVRSSHNKTRMGKDLATAITSQPHILQPWHLNQE